MAEVPRRENSRKPIRVGMHRPLPKRDLGAEIRADIARRAALPEDHPDHAIDDSDTTGTMGIRDNATLRKNAEQVRKGK
jgi:hypothetical protein